jgi:hypothetical protein
MKKGNRVYGIYSWLLFTIIAAILPFVNCYFFRFGTLPKEKYLLALAVFGVAYLFVLFLWFIVIIARENRLIILYPLNPFKKRLTIEANLITTIKYTIVRGRWSFKILEVFYTDPKGIYRSAQFDTFLFKFDIQRLEKMSNGKFDVIIIDD